MQDITWYTHTSSEYMLPSSDLVHYVHEHLFDPPPPPSPSLDLDVFFPSLCKALNTSSYNALTVIDRAKPGASTMTPEEARLWLTIILSIQRPGKGANDACLARIQHDGLRLDDHTILERMRAFDLWLCRHYYPDAVAWLDLIFPPEVVFPLAIDTMIQRHEQADHKTGHITPISTNAFWALRQIRATPLHDDITTRRARALLTHPALERLVTDYQKGSSQRFKGRVSTSYASTLIQNVPSRRLFDALLRDSSGQLLTSQRVPLKFYFAHVNDPRDILPYVSKITLTEQELIALIAMHYEADKVNMNSLSATLEVQRRRRKDREDLTLPRALAHIHDPRIVPYMYELTRKGHHDMKPYLSSEGANAIEGLVAMCARKGSKRDFALHILTDYVERGHGDMVRQSLSQLSKKAAQSMEDALFSKRDELPQEEHFYELDRETIEDKLAQLATFPLDDRQRIDLSYGGRIFKIYLDANAEVGVLDTETKKVVKKLPNARADEDAYHINMFRDSLTSRKREARKHKGRLIKELEQKFKKMICWDRPGWEKEVSSSALHTSIASSFVWGTYDDAHSLVTPFYRDPQGKLLDVDYNEISLPEDACITLVHPLDFETHELGAWSTFMADMERVQLFEQLARRVFAPDCWEEEKVWQAETFKDSETMSIALRKYPGWYATYLRRGNQAKRWFAKQHLARFDHFALLVVRAQTWDVVTPEVPHRTGLHLLPLKSPYATGHCSTWESLPARVVSELCLTLHDVAHKFGKPS